jgi:hypothetical protein
MHHAKLSFSPNRFAEILTFVICIREVGGSNIDRYTDYSVSPGFLQCLEKIVGILLQIRPRALPSTSFPIYY